MKHLVLFLALSSAFLPAQAQDEPLVVAPIEGRELRFDFPRTGTVYARDLRRAALPTGVARLQIEGIGAEEAARVVPRLGNGRVLQNLPAPAPILAPSLANFIGKPLAAWEEKDGKYLKTTGILRLLSGFDSDGARSSEFVLEGEGGVLRSLARGGLYVLPEIKGEVALPFPLWRVAGEGETSVEVNRTFAGLNWSPRYVGFLSPDRKTVELGGWIDMVSPSDFDWRGARFSLVDAEGRLALPPNLMPRSGASSLSFWNGKFSVVQSLSFTNTQPFVNIGSEETFSPVNRTFKTLENGGAFLPRGPLTLWRQEENSAGTPSNFESFGAAKGDAPLVLPLADQATDATVLRVVESNKLLNPQTREVIIRWKVRSQNGVNLSISDALPPGANIKEASLKPVENTPRALRFETSGSTEFTYRYVLPAS